jgi:exoribonuclease-2
MEVGNIVEYIDRQKITCAVVLEVKKQRLRLLTENNREINLAASRLLHRDSARLDLSMGRDKTVNALKEVAGKRQALINHVTIKDIWDVLNTEQEWIDLATMTEFCFPDGASGDYEAAVMRAFFNDRLYFKFNPTGFFPNSQEQVERLQAQRMEAERRERIIDVGGTWLKSILAHGAPEVPADPSEVQIEITRILKSYYLFEKECPHYALARAILAKAGIEGQNAFFQVLVKLGIFEDNENIDLHRFEIKTDFTPAIEEIASDMIVSLQSIPNRDGRRDLTSLPVLTIDGQGTLDFDDALSIEGAGDCIKLGIHIVDVGSFIKKGDVIDREAQARGSSIYMPDQKISMLPASLAEGLCSLRADEVRPAISTMINVLPTGEINDYEIFASLIKVDQQLTYYDVNIVADQNNEMIVLRDIAEKFRARRW